MFFVGGIVPGSKAAALNIVQYEDFVASVDGRVLSSSDCVEDVARMMDEPFGTDADVLLLREVPETGLVRVNARFQRIWTEEEGLDDDNQHDNIAFEEDAAMKSSPRSFDSSSSRASSNASSSGRRYRPFYSHGSFDTQISTPQQSPLGERRGTHVFNDVSDFGDDCDHTTMHPAEITRCGVGLMLQPRYFGSSQMLLVDGIVPGGAADACRRVMVGDALLSVDGRSVEAFSSMDEAIETLIGPKDSPVTLLLHRALTGSSYTVTLVRRVHKSAAVDSSNSRSSSRSNSRSNSRNS